MHDELADRFMAAITAGDVDTLRSLYAPGALIWHNGPGAGGGSEQGVDDNLRTLRWLSRNLRDFRYEEIRRDPLPSGYVQRHVLRGHLDTTPAESGAAGPGGDTVPGGAERGGGAAGDASAVGAGAGRVPIEIAACLFVTVDEDGRISRIEEYADTRGSDPLRELAAARRATRS